jgi:hypothetical protein
MTLTTALGLLVLLFLVPLAGCSLAPSDQVLAQLMSSERSWCAVINTIYGTGRFSGTGIKNGRVTCNQEGMTVTSSGSAE